jgi:hypothetical protein
MVSLALFLALTVAATAAAAPAAPGDGTLSVRNAEAAVGLAFRGVAIGRIGAGTLEVDSEVCIELNVWGEEAETSRIVETEAGVLKTVCVFSGKDIRFRLTGTVQEPLTVRIKRSRDVGLSVVGRGEGWIRGLGFASGQWALNTDEYVPVPFERTTFKLAAPTT